MNRENIKKYLQYLPGIIVLTYVVILIASQIFNLTS